MGHTIQFGEGSGVECEGTISKYKLLRFDDATRDCEFEDFEGTNVPTNMLTNTPTITTPSPTKRITPTPTKKPFALAVATFSPSKTPTTKNPTSSVVPPEVVFGSCGNGICNLSEYDTTCSSDCKGVKLEADLDDEAISNDAGGDGYIKSEDADGTMFSMSSQRDIVLTSLNIFSNIMGTERVEVYIKEGSYIGHETDRDSWTKVYDNVNNLWGPAQSTQLNLNNTKGVSIVADSTVSFYVFSVSGVQCYILEYDETGDNALVVSDNVLDVYQGIDQSAKWSGILIPDADLFFRGTFQYDVVMPPTISPTVAPTVQVTPTVASSEKTLSPTKYITRPVPTNEPTMQETSTSTSSGKTVAPTLSTPNDRPNPLAATVPSARPITSVQSSAPPIVVVTAQPNSTSTTGPPADEATTPVIQEYIVSSKMVLSPSDLLDQVSEKIWIDVTSKTIRTEVLTMFGIDSNVTVVKQTTVVGARQVRMLSKKGSSLRNLQSPSSPLEIDFTTAIRFPSNKNDWDGNEMVASAFNTVDKQSKYFGDLEAVNGSYFQSLENMVLEVDGKVVTLPDSGIDDSAPIGAESGGGDGGGSGNSLIVIVAAVVGGGFLLFFMAIGIYYTRRTKNSKRQEVRSLESIHQEEQTRSELGLEVESSPLSNELDNQCFGTIESKEGAMDDISAMEELDFGDVGQAGMNTDITVGESIQSSQQQKYVYGIGNQMGDSTVFTGSGTRQTESDFNDDHTFEDLYGPNPGISNDGEGSSFHRFTVVAPAGLLGIVLDNPNFDVPVVHAIKETSALHGKVRVDDLLLSVDGVDCRGMSTSNISKFLSSRSRNPTRTLELVRS